MLRAIILSYYIFLISSICFKRGLMASGIKQNENRLMNYKQRQRLRGKENVLTTGTIIIVVILTWHLAQSLLVAGKKGNVFHDTVLVIRKKGSILILAGREKSHVRPYKKKKSSFCLFPNNVLGKKLELNIKYNKIKIKYNK